LSASPLEGPECTVQYIVVSEQYGPVGELDIHVNNNAGGSNPYQVALQKTRDEIYVDGPTGQGELDESDDEKPYLSLGLYGQLPLIFVPAVPARPSCSDLQHQFDHATPMSFEQALDSGSSGPWAAMIEYREVSRLSMTPAPVGLGGHGGDGSILIFRAVGDLALTTATADSPGDIPAGRPYLHGVLTVCRDGHGAGSLDIRVFAFGALFARFRSTEPLHPDLSASQVTMSQPDSGGLFWESEPSADMMQNTWQMSVLLRAGSTPT
jgi:hypothetical protein